VRDKLRKIEALFASAGTAGERLRPRRRCSGLLRVSPNSASGIRRSRCNSRCRTNGHAISFSLYAGRGSIGFIGFIGSGALPSWSGRPRASSTSFCGPNSSNSTAPFRPTNVSFVTKSFCRHHRSTGVFPGVPAELRAASKRPRRLEGRARPLAKLLRGLGRLCDGDEGTDRSKQSRIDLSLPRLLGRQFRW
jgi:hypothetical protein